MDINANAECGEPQEKLPAKATVYKPEEVSEAACVNGRKSPLTREDFLQFITHKFKTNIVRYAQVKKGEHILVAFSGGFSSRCMVHMLYQSLSHEARKRMFFSVSLLYIDEGAAFSHTDEQRYLTRSTIREIADSYQYPLHIINLEDIFEENILEPKMDSTDKGQKLNKLLYENTRTHSAREDVYRLLIENLIVDFADKRGFTKVLTGESGTHSAVDTLVGVCSGRGFDLAAHSQYMCKSRSHPNVSILRPMKDFLNKEIAIFNYYQKLNCVFTESVVTKSKLKSSIRRLTEGFLESLQRDFPSTIHTILRTTEKLRLPSVTHGVTCPLCGDLLTEDEFKASVQKQHIADQLVDKLSKLGVQEAHGLGTQCCYACGVLVRDLTSSNTPNNNDGGSTDRLELPPFVSHNIANNSVKLSIDQMREEIKEFLIE